MTQVAGIQSPEPDVFRPQYGFLWVLSGVATLAVAVCAVGLGVAIMPPLSRAQEIGTVVPWVMTWGLIALTAAIAVYIAGTLIRIGLSGRQR